MASKGNATTVGTIIIRFALVYSCFLSLLVFLFVAHKLTPRQFAYIGGFGYMLGFVVLYMLLKQARLRANGQCSPATETNRVEERRKILRLMRSSKIMIGVLACALLYALWTARELSFTTKIVGIVVNLLLTASYFRVFLKQKARLRDLDQPPSDVVSASFKPNSLS